MKKLLISSALAALVSTNAYAAFTDSDTFDVSVAYVTAITIDTLSDITIDDMQPGEAIDTAATVAITSDTDRNINCSLTDSSDEYDEGTAVLTLKNAGSATDKFTLNLGFGALGNTSSATGVPEMACEEIRLKGTLPSSGDGTSHATYTVDGASITLSVSYN